MNTDAPLDRDEPRSLSETLADRIREQILSGELATGAKLPTEAQLSSAFGVSRTVVREALQHLRASGLVESFQGRGTFVLDVPQPQDAGGLRDVRSRQDILHLIDFRIALECEGAALAATRRTPAQLAAVERALASFEAAAAQPTLVVQADFDFHAAVAQASGNPFIVETLTTFGPRMIMLQRTGLDERHEVTNAAHFQRVLTEHTSIAAAIERADAPSAAAAMRVHLAGSRARLRRD